LPSVASAAEKKRMVNAAVEHHANAALLVRQLKIKLRQENKIEIFYAIR
jgi:hypothetical protein